MAEHVKIPLPDVEALKSDSCAIQGQLEEVAEKHGQDAARPFAGEAATVVEATHCPRHTPPTPLAHQTSDHVKRKMLQCTHIHVGSTRWM